MSIAVIDFFEIVRVNQVKDQVSGSLITIVRVRAQRMADVSFDCFREVSAVAETGQRIDQRSFLQHVIGTLQFLIQAVMLEKDEKRHRKHCAERY